MRKISIALILIICFSCGSSARAEDLDTEIFRRINSNGSNPTLDSLMLGVSDGSIPFEAATNALLWFWEPNKGKETFILSNTALATSAIAALAIKSLVASPRPYTRLQNVTVLGSKTGDYSFPSGHTAMAFAFAMILSEEYKQWTIPLYGFAATVGFSRIYTGHHFPSDVLGGALLGYLSGRIVLANKDFLLSLAGLKKKKTESSWLIYPVLTPEHQAIKIAYTL